MSAQEACLLLWEGEGPQRDQWACQDRSSANKWKVMVHEFLVQTELKCRCRSCVLVLSRESGWEGGAGHGASQTANWPACEKPGAPSPLPTPIQGGYTGALGTHGVGCCFARAHVGGALEKEEELSAGRGVEETSPPSSVCLREPALGLAGPLGSRPLG